MVFDAVFDYSKLRGRIIEKYETLGAFASALEISRTELSTILKSGKPFSSKRIYAMANKLEILADEIGVYFFTPKVSNS